MTGMGEPSAALGASGSACACRVEAIGVNKTKNRKTVQEWRQGYDTRILFFHEKCLERDAVQKNLLELPCRGHLRDRLSVGPIANRIGIVVCEFCVAMDQNIGAKRHTAIGHSVADVLFLAA